MSALYNQVEYNQENTFNCVFISNKQLTDSFLLGDNPGATGNKDVKCMCTKEGLCHIETFSSEAQCPTCHGRCEDECRKTLGLGAFCQTLASGISGKQEGVDGSWICQKADNLFYESDRF